jgi:hypothetical protein
MEDKNKLNEQFSIFNNISGHYIQNSREPLIRAEGLKGKELILFELPKNVNT